MYDVQSVLLFEKKDALSIVNDGKAVVTLTEFTVDSNEIDTVQRQYQLDMERAVRDDAGYKAGYVLRERNAKIVGTSFKSIAIKKPLLNT